MRGSKGSYSSWGFVGFFLFLDLVFWIFEDDGLAEEDFLMLLLMLLLVVVEEEGEVSGDEDRDNKNSEGSVTGRPLMEMLGAT